MEVGAVKQAFNNEVILLKKKLNQAKIQIIHKLTRKAKQLAEKKAPEPLKEKLKRKAESAVNEVLIIKKIKPKDLAQFIVTHKGELKDFLNKATVDNEKACARLLLHKVLQDKYKFIRGRFSNVPIKDLFMSRLERRKMKKEEKEKQKNKKKGKNNKVVNSEGDWNVEDVEVANKKELGGLDDAKIELSDEDDDPDQFGAPSEEENESEKSEVENESNKSEKSKVEDESNDSNEEVSDEKANVAESEEENSETEMEQVSKTASTVSVDKPTLPQKQEVLTKSMLKEVNIKPKAINKKNPEKKLKEVNKTKNFNEKIQQRKLNKDLDAPTGGRKIVDPFFITSTGGNYMSVVEPRGPDEVKDEHKQGNRKLRRAVMFGHVPKSKPRRENNNYRDDNRYNKQNGLDKGDNFRSKFNNKQDFTDRKGFNNDFNSRKRFNDTANEEKPEKLHPSWEAKKKKSGILPFEGKKIVFD